MYTNDSPGSNGLGFNYAELNVLHQNILYSISQKLKFNLYLKFNASNLDKISDFTNLKTLGPVQLKDYINKLKEKEFNISGNFFKNENFVKLEIENNLPNLQINNNINLKDFMRTQKY